MNYTHFGAKPSARLDRILGGGHATVPERKERRQTRNDDDRRQWIDNDEGLYNWQRQSRLSMREFIKQNRAEIDSAIDGVLNRKPN